MNSGQFGLWYGNCDYHNITADRESPTTPKGTKRER